MLNIPVSNFIIIIISVKAGNGKGQRTAQRHNCSADSRRQECDRDAVGQVMFKRAGENQRRVRQAIGDRQDAAHRAGKYVDQSCAEIKSAQKDAHLRPGQDYTIVGATRMTGLCGLVARPA